MVVNKSAMGSIQHARAPLSGRDTELRVLTEALDVVRSGTPQIVTILGPPGIGKTRLVQEFVLGLRAGPSADQVRVFRGTARGVSKPYGAFARMLRARFGLVEGMDEDLARTQVRGQVAKVLDDRKVGDVAYFLGTLLGVHFEESPLTRAVLDDVQQGQQILRAVFKAFVDADAEVSPMVLVLDDLHAAHDDSIALLRYLLEYVSGKVLFVCVGRDGILSHHEDWERVGEGRHQVVELSALSEESSADVMRALLTPCTSPVDELVEAANRFAAGNPMLLEQMVRIFHDVGVLREDDHMSEVPSWTVHLDKLAGAQLPLTIEDAVNARIAALDPRERRVLQHAAVMGSVFWHGGFVALLRAEELAPELWNADDRSDIERLNGVIEGLIERDYMLQLPDSTFPGTSEYIFKHNKERLEVEKRISPAIKRRCHRCVGDWMEHQVNVHANEEYSAMLASHRELGGESHQAGLAYLRAGNLARARYANADACEYYEKGLDLLGESEVVQRLEALHNYGDVLQLSGRIDDALAAFREMLRLAFRLNLMGKGGAAHNRIGRLYRSIGSLDEAATYLQTALALFKAAGDYRGVASTIDDMGKLFWMKGEYDLALRDLQDGLERRRKLGDRRSIALSLNNLGLVLQDSGDFKAAVQSFESALTIRREIQDMVGVVVTLANLGRVRQQLRDYPNALRLFTEARDTVSEIGDRNRLALILTCIGECHYGQGNAPQAIGVLHQAEELCDELGDKLGLAEALRALGQAYMLQGDLKRARDCIGRAVDLFATVRSKVKLGSALRTLGEITAGGGWGAAHTKSAREYFARSVAIFEQTGNEVELARTFQVYANFLRAEVEFTDDDAAQQEAAEMQQRAADIFARLRGSLSTEASSSPGPGR